MPQFNLQIVVSGIDRGASKVLKQTDKAVTGLGKAGQGAKADLGPLSGALDGLKKAVLPATAIIVGFGLAVHEAFQFAEEGAQIERLRAAGDQLASSLGGNMQEIVTRVREASLGMVSDTQIISGANKAMMLGLGADAGQLGELMQVAAFRARAMGLTTAQAFDDIVRGVGRMSPLILDNLGIIVDAKSRYEEWAQANGRTAASLTAMEKKQILLTQVIAEGNAQIEAAGGFAVDNAGKFEQLSAGWANFIDGIKEGISGPLIGVVDALNSTVFAGQKLSASFQEQELRVRDSSMSFSEYEQAIIQAATRTGKLDDMTRTFIDDEGRLIEVQTDVLGQVTELVRAEGLWTKETFNAQLAQKDLGKVLVTDGVGAVRQYVEATQSAVESTGDLGEAQRDLKQEMKDLQMFIAGPVGKENERFQEEQIGIQEEMANVEAQIAELRAEQGLYVASTEEQVVTQFKASQAATSLAEAQKAVAENSDPERVDELNFAVARAQIAFDKASQAAGDASGVFVDNGEQIGELEAKYGGLQGQLDATAEAHRNAMNKIIFDILMAQLSVDGLTESEATLAFVAAEKMGLIDEETRDAALGMNAALRGFAEGEGLFATLDAMDEVAERAGRIPRTITIDISANVQGFGGLTREEVLERLQGRVPGFQTGIDVVPRRMLAMLHPGEQVVPREDNPNIPGNAGRGGGNEYHLHISQSAGVDGAQMRSAFGFLQMMEG